MFALRTLNMEFIAAAIAELEAMPTVTPCPRCDHFDSATNDCRRWNAAVPSEHQEKGCDKWEAGIPF